MPRNNHERIIRNVVRNHSPIVEPPSSELERKALHEFGERDRPAVQAIFHARRDERWLTFCVEPVIAAAYGLSQRAMTRAMDRLEGSLIQTVYKERGEPRVIRLLPDWENPEALAGDLARRNCMAFAEAEAAFRAVELQRRSAHFLPSDLSPPPEILAKLRSLLDPPSDP